MTISNEVLDELLKGCERPEDLFGDTGPMKELKIKLMERMLGAELTAHLGYETGKDAPPEQPNRRNGSAGRRLEGQDGEVPLSVPRGRDVHLVRHSLNFWPGRTANPWRATCAGFMGLPRSTRLPPN